MSQAFPFTRDFDQEIEAEAKQTFVRAARVNGPTQEEFDLAVEAARQQGFDQGRTEGLSEGQAAEQEKITAQLAATSDRLSEILGPLLTDQVNVQKKFEYEAIGVLSDIVEKLLPEIMKTQSRSLVDQQIEAAALHAAGSQWLNITVHPDLVEAVEQSLKKIISEENSKTILKVSSDPKFDTGDVKAFWESGRSNYSLKLLCEKIIDTISNAGNPTSMTVVENNNG